MLRTISSRIRQFTLFVLVYICFFIFQSFLLVHKVPLTGDCFNVGIIFKKWNILEYLFGIQESTVILKIVSGALSHSPVRRIIPELSEEFLIRELTFKECVEITP